MGRRASACLRQNSSSSPAVAKAKGVSHRDSPATGRNARPVVTPVMSRSGASMIRLRPAKVRLSRNSPGKSSRWRRRSMPAARITPTTALIQKIARQDATVRTAAPYNGPTTLPSSCIAPTTPRGRPRFSGGHRSPTSASVGGIKPPPPMPWIRRPATIVGRSYAAAVTIEPMAKISRQPSNTGTRPRRSAMRPIRGRTPT